MAINTYLSTIESKNKLSKQEEQTESWIWRAFDLLVHRPALNPLSHTSQGLESVLMVARGAEGVGDWVSGEGMKKYQ